MNSRIAVADVKDHWLYPARVSCSLLSLSTQKIEIPAACLLSEPKEFVVAGISLSTSLHLNCL